MSHSNLAVGLAHAFLSPGPWTVQGLTERGERALSTRPWWLPRLARAVRRAYPRAPLDRAHELSVWIKARDELLAGPHPDEPRWARGSDARLTVRRWLAFSPEMGRMRWDVPAIATVGELATFFGLSAADLAFLADVRSLERVVLDEKLRNYRYIWIAKRAGGLRVLEAPKPRLRALQRRILDEILERVPPHDAAHGFRRGRSAMTFARAHIKKTIVLRFDLEAFFPAVSASRVFGIFREAGYPEAVAHVLTAVVTNRLPPSVWHHAPRPSSPKEIHGRFHLGRRLAEAHLPQGAPTSPAIANLCAFRLDVRLSGLAAKVGASYTRYADDLAFSGDQAFARRADAFSGLVSAITREEGFEINTAKSRAMRDGACQRLCGLVVNDHPQVARDEYDRLKAILYNASRRGLSAENRDGHRDFRAHLRGRVEWVAASSPTRRRKLIALFDAIP